LSSGPGRPENHEPHAGGEPPPGNEEELRARLEEELRKIKVGDVLLQTVVTLVNLGGQRLGLTEATRDLRDPAQARLAIEAVRTLLPLLESDEELGRSVGPIRDALAQLQLAYAQEAGAETGSGESPAEGRAAGTSREAPGGPGPQERPAEERPGDRPPRRSGGRLWTPPGSG
jgi:hypothetical protein